MYVNNELMKFLIGSGSDEGQAICHKVVASRGTTYAA